MKKRRRIVYYDTPSLKIDNQLLIYNRCTNSYQLTTILFKKTVRYGEYHLCSKLFEELSQEY